jgi:hypothetical protein
MRVSAVLILPFLAKLGALLMRGLVGLFPGIAADLKEARLQLPHWQ